jgi:hypothetical protein
MQDKRPQTPLGQLWNSIQSWLFPMLEDEIGALDEKHRQFVAVGELCAPQDHMAAYRWCGNLPAPRRRGRQAAVRPATAWRCARRTSPRPCGTSRRPAT